jgi:MinD-like ATPase involved in chromosome partitioning or flagellar assembly
VELPTYTSIWRIEKRLYKLYDFRLPMPLPVGQAAAFTAITVPYVVVLTLSGLPFSHTLFWLYVLPPGVLTWLVTRPVLESKRLPELVVSQVRYLAEPAMWCRLAPAAEKDQMTVVGRVWRRAVTAPGAAGGPGAQRVSAPTAQRPAARVVAPEPGPARERALAGAPPGASPREQAPEPGPARERALAGAPPREQAPPGPAWAPARVAAVPRPGAGQPAPVIPGQPPPLERVLGHPGTLGGRGWRNRVTVTPGGHRPGRPDLAAAAVTRASAPLHGSRLVVVLGCSVGAGQTVTALLLAELLAQVRGQRVAALDLNPGPASLAALAGQPATTISAFLAARPPAGQPAHAAPRRALATGEPTGPGGVEVICDEPAGPQSWLGAPAGTGTALRPGRLLEFLARRYPLTVADPGAAVVARLLPAADQLVLVAPASPDAAQAAGMTLEWLHAHGQGALVARAITVLNGVSQRSQPHAARAEQVVRGRCRAVVRVPWDDRLAEPPAERGIRESLAPPVPSSRLDRLRPQVRHAYLALAGVVVAGLATAPGRGAAASGAAAASRVLPGGAPR